MNFPPNRQPPRGPDPRGAPPRGGPPPQRQGRQPGPPPMVPVNVLRALIGQSRRRCETYVEMMRKLGQGLEQLSAESQQLASYARSPQAARQLEQGYLSFRAAAEAIEQHSAAHIGHERRMQEILARWRGGEMLPTPPGPGFQQPPGPPGFQPPAPRQGFGPGGGARPSMGAGPAAQRRPMMSPPPGYVEQERQPQSPFGDVVLPPDEALTGYAAHAAGKRQKPAPTGKTGPAQAGASGASAPAQKPEKTNGPAAASAPAMVPFEGESPQDDEAGGQT